MGGRGGRSGMQFAIPRGSGDNFSRNALMEQPPETLREALGTKGAAKTIDNAMKNANPYFSRSFSEYSENCQRCVVAYELRRRGYDVIAQATYAGDKWPQSISVNGKNYGTAGAARSSTQRRMQSARQATTRGQKQRC